MEKWRGKIAIVTGASSGIGAAIVKDLASNGINVIGLARRSEKVEELAKELSHYDGKIYARKCDISDYAALKETFKWIEEQFSVVNILINNAGIGQRERVFDFSDEATESINKMIDLNFTNLVHCTREAVRLMKKSNDYGFIVNISSILGHTIPYPNYTGVYPPTKYAVSAFSEVIRQELIIDGDSKIRVTNLSPGTVKTDVFKTVGIEDLDKFFTERVHIHPEDVSAGVMYALSTPYNVNVTQLTIKPIMEKF
jgi:NADP+-dependent farnesol dehydrogenase